MFGKRRYTERGIPDPEYAPFRADEYECCAFRRMSTGAQPAGAVLIVFQQTNNNKEEVQS